MPSAKTKTRTRPATRSAAARAKPKPKPRPKRQPELKRVLVRTYSAGVHYGLLRRRDGKAVVLEQARRIHRWFGAWTLNEIATAGLDQATSRVSGPVASIILTEAIEIIDVTPAGAASIEGAKWAA